MEERRFLLRSGCGGQVVVRGWILKRFGSEGQQDSRLDVGEEEE